MQTELEGWTRETCPTCDGKRTVTEWGKRQVTCGYCDGIGAVFTRPASVAND